MNFVKEKKKKNIKNKDKIITLTNLRFQPEYVLCFDKPCYNCESKSFAAYNNFFDLNPGHLVCSKSERNVEQESPSSKEYDIGLL